MTVGASLSTSEQQQQAGLATTRVSLRLTPHGQLVCESADDAPPLGEAVAARLAAAFAHGSGHGLLQLGAGEVGEALPAFFVLWRSFATRYVSALCLHGAATNTNDAVPITIADIPAPTEGELFELVLMAPIMAGADYLAPDRLRALWLELGRAVTVSLAASGADLQSFLNQNGSN